MQKSSLDSAATFLINRRKQLILSERLAPDLRPATSDDALVIQQILMQKMGDDVGGWKCVLPVGETLNIAPIFASTIHRESPCPIKPDKEKGVCLIEPEIAFRFKTDLPVRDTEYSEADILAALAGAHSVLELIQFRYGGMEEVSYLENLADCLFNQGMFLGPELVLDKAMASSVIDFELTQGNDVKSFTGNHPNNGPILPVLWMVNFLRNRGIGIKAGQVVTTGSFAGVLEVKPDIPFTIEYTGLGRMTVLLKPV